MNEDLDQLAFKFFKLFAQYESSLKERGFFRADGSGNVNVDWDRFANEVVGKDFKSKLGHLRAASDYILNEPPMKQVVEQSKIVWADVPNTDQSVQALFGHICRIRNNLFHGAKFNASWFDPERSNTLLRHGLDLLEHYRAKVGL